VIDSGRRRESLLHSVQIDCGSLLSLLPVGPGSILPGVNCRYVKPCTHRHLVLPLRTRGAIPPCSIRLHVVMFNLAFYSNNYRVSMKWSTHWEASSCSASQDPKVHYIVHESPPLVPILSRMNPIPTTPSTYLTIQFYISPHTTKSLQQYTLYLNLFEMCCSITERL
jgi:hypothetical protein